MKTNCKKNKVAWVCGCNGETYRNECLANSVGVSVDYKGKCDNEGEEYEGGEDSEDAAWEEDSEDTSADETFGIAPTN